MGCQASNNRRDAVKKKTQYKGLFKDKVVEDINKRQMVSVNLL